MQHYVLIVCLLASRYLPIRANDLYETLKHERFQSNTDRRVDESLVAARSKDSPNALCHVKTIETIKEDALSQPCCTMTAKDKVQCFVLGLYRNVEHVNISIDVYHVHGEWVDIHGRALDDLVCTTTGVDGFYDIVINNVEPHLQIRSHTSDGWGRWKYLDSSSAFEAPSCAYTSSKRLECLQRSMDNKLYNHPVIDGEWTDGILISKDYFSSRPSCISRSAGIVSCFISGTGENSGNVIQFDARNGVFGDATIIAGNISGRVVATGNDIRIDLFALGHANQLLQATWKKDDGWSSWTDLGGTWKTEPECFSSNDPYTIYCYLSGPDFHLTHNFFIDGEWKGWLPDACMQSYHIIGRPSCLYTSDNELTCYVTDAFRRLLEVTYDIIKPEKSSVI